MSMTSPAILSNFFEKQWTQNHPQYLSGLSRALYPATFLEIAVYMRRLSVRQISCQVYFLHDAAVTHFLHIHGYLFSISFSLN